MIALAGLLLQKSEWMASLPKLEASKGKKITKSQNRIRWQMRDGEGKMIF